MVDDPDSGLATDRVAGEDADASERSLTPAVLGSAGPGQVWGADRHFCTRPLLDAVEAADVFMGRKKHTAEEIVAKLCQVDVLVSQGRQVAAC